MQWLWHRDERRIWLRRLLCWLAAPLLACELVYVIAANLILATGTLDQWLTGASEGLLLEIESGWTLWPGRVHVKGVELHFEDYNVQFSVALDEATVDIALWQLPAKTFHLTRVRGSGVRYLFRHKVASAKGHERRLALYPKIAGYSDPPLFVGPPTPPLTDEQYDLWTVHLEDVDVTAREIWFLEYRFTGKARAKGAFRIEPERDARTERCSLALDGTLRVGAQTVASTVRGWLHAQSEGRDLGVRASPGALCSDRRVGTVACCSARRSPSSAVAQHDHPACTRGPCLVGALETLVGVEAMPHGTLWTLTLAATLAAHCVRHRLDHAGGDDLAVGQLQRFLLA